MPRIKSQVIAAVCAALLQSCMHTAETGEFHPIDADGWLYGDTLSYRLEAPDSMWHGDIAVAVRHTASYPYTNLWLELSYPPGDSIASDSINIVLADDFGNWLGRGSGLSRQTVDTVARGVSLAAPAEVELRHIMRNDKITDIEQIGVIFITTARP